MPNEGMHTRQMQDQLNMKVISKHGIKITVFLVVLLLITMMVVVILQVVGIVVHLHLVSTMCPNCNNTSIPISSTTGEQSSCDNKALIAQMTQLMIEHVTHDQNHTELLQEVHEVMQGSAQKLTNIVHTLLSLQMVNLVTQGSVDDILISVVELLISQNGSLLFASSSPISCKDIKQKIPRSPSGYYTLNGILTYCHMESLCDTEGGWTRIGQLDMSDATMSCPSGFRLYESGGVRACGRPNGGPGCSSIEIPSNGIDFSQVCGRVVGYQYGSPDAVDTRFATNATRNDINSYYVDGVSITQGDPREHIWTLMAGVGVTFNDSGNCPCNTLPGNTQEVQSFVGTDYFCESGNPNNDWEPKLYSDDPLWDGEKCSLEGDCCLFSGSPWFHRIFNSSSSDYIEMRLCNDEGTVNEDVPISFYEIFVK